MYDLVIKNGTVVNSEHSYLADVAVNGEKISALGLGLKGRREIDAAGALVIPGGVDTHVHLSLDLGGGLVSSDDFFTGTRAAAFGGTTTVVPFLHPEEGDGPRQVFDKRQGEAEGQVVVDYGWHMNIGPGAFGGDYGDADGPRRFVEQSAALGISTFKLYMAYGYRLDDVRLYRAMEAIAGVGGLPVLHAENFDLISMLVDRAVADGELHPRMHEQTRPAEFEAEAVNRVIAMARRVGLPVEIFHVGNREVVETIRRAREEGVLAFGETCPQYLFLNTEAFERPGVEAAYVVCAPPIRPEDDRLAMWQAIAEDSLQLVSTDHCPFSKERKEQGLSEGFHKIPGGVPSIEMRMTALYSEGVATGLFGPERWVELNSTFPARLHGFESKGVLAPGYDADIVIFDPQGRTLLTAEQLHESCGWTPYEGTELQGRVRSTMVRGRMVVQDGEFVGSRGGGRYIERSGVLL
ncbi:MAG TPA: dihydropyrimidinase [Sediminispirochaeta sp.]|nr:dihydropyrimidinase [Sediminispirochaeta sp.]